MEKEKRTLGQVHYLVQAVTRLLYVMIIDSSTVV